MAARHDPESPLLRPNDVAEQLAVSRAWVYEAARTGRIPSVRIGGEHGPLWFVPEDIERWIDEARAEWSLGHDQNEGDPKLARSRTLRHRSKPRGPGRDVTPVGQLPLL